MLLMGVQAFQQKPCLHYQSLDYNRPPAFFILNHQTPLWLQSKCNWKISCRIAFYASKNEIRLSFVTCHSAWLPWLPVVVFSLPLYLIILQIYSKRAFYHSWEQLCIRHTMFYFITKHWYSFYIEITLANHHHEMNVVFHCDFIIHILYCI